MPTKENLEAFFNSQDSTIHNITDKGVAPTLDSSVSAKDLTKPSSPLRDAQGRLLLGSVLNPLGLNSSLSQLLKEKGDKPCAYVPGMSWAQAIIENEWSQALTDPIARKHLLDRLLGRAVESVNLNQSGIVKLLVVYDDYVNPNETKQLAEGTPVDNNKDNSATFEAKQ